MLQIISKNDAEDSNEAEEFKEPLSAQYSDLENFFGDNSSPENFNNLRSLTQVEPHLLKSFTLPLNYK